MITEAGFDPTAIHYDQLRKLFLSSIEWLHFITHHTGGQNPADFSMDLTDETQRLALELVSDPYIRGIIEGRLSNCNHGAVDGKNQQPVFKPVHGLKGIDGKIVVRTQI